VQGGLDLFSLSLIQLPSRRPEEKLGFLVFIQPYCRSAFLFRIDKAITRLFFTPPIGLTGV